MRSCHELLLIVTVVVFVQLVIASALLGNLLTRCDRTQDVKHNVVTVRKGRVFVGILETYHNEN